MKKVTITLLGTLTYSAHRTLEIEVSDDADLSTIAPETLNDLADFERIPWDYSEFGYLDLEDFSIDAFVSDDSEDRNPQ